VIQKLNHSYYQNIIRRRRRRKMGATVERVIVHREKENVVWTLPSKLPNRVIKVLESSYMLNGKETTSIEVIYVKKAG
jgi:hypothetical protein